MCSQTVNMTLFDDSTESDNESEYFDAFEYIENKDESDFDDEFQDARDSYNDEVYPVEVELAESNNKQHQEASNRLEDEKHSTANPDIPAAATNSVLAEKRKFDDIAKEDQETESKSPVASSSPCVASQNCPKELKSVISFGQSTGFGAMKGPKALSPIRVIATTTGLFATEKPLSFGAATTHDKNTVFNNASTISSDHDNKENINHTFGEGPRSTLAGVEEIKVTTGEEKEKTICQARGRLYVLDSTQNWKERGLGTFRLNKNNNESRLIMRTDSVHRLILNTKLFPGMSVSIAQDKFIRFAVFETVTSEEGKAEAKMVNYALKLGSSTTAEEVCKHITFCISPAPAPKRKLDELAEDDDDNQPSSPQPKAGRQSSPKKQINL